MGRHPSRRRHRLRRPRQLQRQRLRRWPRFGRDDNCRRPIHLHRQYHLWPCGRQHPPHHDGRHRPRLPLRRRTYCPHRCRHQWRIHLVCFGRRLRLHPPRHSIRQDDGRHHRQPRRCGTAGHRLQHRRHIRFGQGRHRVLQRRQCWTCGQRPRHGGRRHPQQHTHRPAHLRCRLRRRRDGLRRLLDR